MSTEERDEFAKLLVHFVRDAAIKSCDVQLHATNFNSPIAKRWREALNSGDSIKFAEMLIADSIDEAIFHLLNSVDEGLFNFLFNSSNGSQLSFSDNDYAGELAGWYSGEWRFKLSGERAYNNFEDLA